MSWGMCQLCNDIVQSKHRHDFVECKCGESFLDGGDDYFRASITMVKIDMDPDDSMDSDEFFAYLDELDNK
jgi:hypothetical protein